MNEPKNPIKKDDVLKIYTDGASRKNPGPSAYAFIFVRGEETIYSTSKYLGTQTNNTAEYTAVIEALKKAVEYTRWKVEVYSDSELIINQINGEWRIKDGHLKDLHNQINTQITNFKEVKFFHVSRENKFIKEADKLCNECLDKNLGKSR
jgi:ribonuclease HI